MAGTDGRRAPRGRLTAELRTAVRDEATRLSTLSDPLTILRAANDTIAGLDREIERIAAVRHRAIADLRREGWSYDRLAAASGLSKARIQQLVGQVRRRTQGAGPTRE